MQINHIHDRMPIIEAMREFDDLGQEKFLEKYGFRPAREFCLKYQGKQYHSKAIVGVAYKYIPGSAGPLKPREFSGGRETVQRLLEGLGFEVDVEKVEEVHSSTSPKIADG